LAEMPTPPTRRIPRWAPYAVAALWLALGYANLVRGVAHPGVAYRPWSFLHHSYSDILALGGDRYLHGGRPLPYLEDRIEYPVLLGLALWAPSYLPGGQVVHFTVSYLFLALCLLASVAMLGRIPGASPWWLAGTPALVYYAGLNWDLLPIALLVASVLALSRGRPAASGALSALGAAAKLWPVAIVPPAAAALLARRDGRSLARGAAAFAAVTLLVNLPFALAAPAAWGWFARYNRQRSAENSIWEAIGVKSPSVLNAATLSILALAALLAAAAAYRAREEERDRAVRLGTALVLVVWIATNKIYSPQYALYAFAAGALASAPAWTFFVLSAVAAVDYHLAFEVRSSRGLFVFFDRTYYAEEAVRTLAYAVLCAILAAAMVRTAARESAVP
jgi:Glycosyltransferase family 87